MASHLTRSPQWQALADHRRKAALDLRDLFAADAQRFDRYSIAEAGILLDYSKHWLSDETVRLLLAMAWRLVT